MKGEAPKFAVVILALVGLLVAIVGISALQRSGGRAGELVFDTESVDAGNVALGQMITQRYQMRNVGDGPVKITRAAVSALEGC